MSLPHPGPRRPERSAILAIALLLVAACGGEPPVEPPVGAAGLLAGPVLDRLAEAWKDGGKALERGDWATAGWAFERVLEIDPEEEVARYLAAVARARMGAEHDTVEHLRRLAEAGSDLVPPADELGELGGQPAVRTMLASLARRARVVGAPQVAFALRLPDLYPEGIAFDPESGDLFLGSLHQRRILRLRRGGAGPAAVSELVGGAAAELGSVVGLRVDPPRRLLWAVSGETPLARGGVDPAAPPPGLVAFALAGGAPRGRYPVPQSAGSDGSAPAQPNDLAVAADGTVYLTDTGRGALLRLAPGADALEVVRPSGSFLWPNGVALSEDDRRLYVADFESGVSVLELDSGRRSRLAHPAGATIHGFDGLYHHRGRLYGVLNIAEPGRVVRLDLAADGRTATAATLVAAGLEAFDTPTTAAITPDGLYLVANSQLDRVGPDGGPLPAEELEDVLVLRFGLE